MVMNMNAACDPQYAGALAYWRLIIGRCTLGARVFHHHGWETRAVEWTYKQPAACAVKWIPVLQRARHAIPYARAIFLAILAGGCRQKSGWIENRRASSFPAESRLVYSSHTAHGGRS